MRNSTLRKRDSGRDKQHQGISAKSLKVIRSVLQEAQEFIIGCREDLELFTFFRKYEKIKLRKRRVRAKIRRYVNEFILSFPTYWQESIKRYSDIIIASIGFVVALPLMASIALAIRVSSRGPMFYKQERVGKSGESFVMYKFRTMQCDAEKESGPMWAQYNDPRITRLGSLLRKTHLDELPQLFNVLKGDMSIVGPRPERPYFVSQLRQELPDYVERLHVKPGITGLAQVKHKYDETLSDVRKKLRYDLLYIKKMCLTLDVKVLMWTIGVILTGKGAR